MKTKPSEDKRDLAETYQRLVETRAEVERLVAELGLLRRERTLQDWIMLDGEGEK
jgi:hypothetical protein